jgi:hypothetical protein
LFSLYFANCSGLSIFDCPFGFLSMLPVALIGNIERKPKGQSKMDKSEQLAT